MMTFGSLFAGIGGFDLGFERAGMKCLWQVESDPFCLSVLQQHWPDMRRHSDVRTFPPQGDWNVDVICGGFPCQDISNAGKREGINGERSGLWSEFLRLISVINPKVAIIENVGALSVRGLQRVVNDLSAIGYDAEWCPLPAAAFGAVHRRERIFVVAYPAGNGLEGWFTAAATGEVPAAPLDHLRDWPAVSEPFGVRSLNGVPSGVDRIRALGNAVCPQVAEWIGRRIITCRGDR